MAKNSEKVRKVPIYPKLKNESQHKLVKKQRGTVKKALKQEKPKGKLTSGDNVTVVKSSATQKKRVKVIKSKAPQVEQVTQELPTCLLLRNLPQSVNYNALKNAIPDAVRMEIYKKGSKRHAFINFESHEMCEKAMKKLQGFTMDGHEVRVKLVHHKPKSNEDATQAKPCSTPSVDKCITLSNLPFSITKPELEEEFPTASEIVLNTNKNGRFRGSCLLKFDSPDDCKVVWDACRGRKIGGRPVQCRAGAWFHDLSTTKPAEKTPGIKLSDLPVEVTNDKLFALFPKGAVVRAHCELNAQGSSKTGIVRFSSVDAQQAALRLLNKKKVFGTSVRCRPWSSHKSRSKTRLLDTVHAPEKPSMSPAAKKSKLISKQPGS